MELMKTAFRRTTNTALTKLYYPLLFICGIGLVVGCKTESAKNDQQTVSVQNKLDFAREEVVAIDKKDISAFLKGKSEEHIRIKKDGSEDYLRTQWIDYDQDGTSDELLFQASVEANASTDYLIVVDSTKTAPENEAVAYSRFVPERIDDYTWENDKVAFRTYGPAAKQAAIDGVPGGVISSGMDLWFKSTKRSIIDEWYQKNTEQGGYYHTDRGEGYDPYHVGGSRGTGGIGVFENDSLYVSENFIDHNTIADGPLRTVFELTYAPWSPYQITETKRITLDLGSNFSKLESTFSAEGEVPNYAIGITLHKNEGDYEINEDAGWFLHWETIDGSQIGEGIVINPKQVDSAFAHISKTPDQSNLLITTKPTDELVYYAGFAWEKSKQINTREDWKNMLEKEVKVIDNPLKIKLK